MSTAETRVPTCYRHPDRETGLSCTECGRPICTECLRDFDPVPRPCDGRKAAERGAAGERATLPRTARLAVARGEPIVTYGLIGLNVIIYLITVAQGSGINQPGGSLFAKWVLFGPLVAAGHWWRLISAGSCTREISTSP